MRVKSQLIAAFFYEFRCTGLVVKIVPMGLSFADWAWII
ncbi:hypothetical protein GPLA_2137 [Paraglaciecola polaris LMG 21857]|uniref:Uncharacterized protein n=1 Tax=Paraglaciecola polaris LMG 21857 TaxID=1129793 RepID=K6ZRW1_9ALTE|nr:hypothetical protein GPLA_2137 [Paraglaciecola polaris LMG 21857]